MSGRGGSGCCDVETQWNDVPSLRFKQQGVSQSSTLDGRLTVKDEQKASQYRKFNMFPLKSLLINSHFPPLLKLLLI